MRGLCKARKLADCEEGQVALKDAKGGATFNVCLCKGSGSR